MSAQVFISSSIRAVESLEKSLEEAEVNETTSLSLSHLIAVMHKPKGPFRGLHIYASDNEVRRVQTRRRTTKTVYFREQVKHEVTVRSSCSCCFIVLLLFLFLTQVKSDGPVNNSRVSVGLPSELEPGSNSTIVFCMVTWPRADGVRDGTGVCTI